MHRDEHDRAIPSSWQANAAAGTAAVRGRLIASRRAGTDAAIVRACTRLRAKRVLDVGCGEGWLSRVLAEAADEVVGIDGSAELVAHARAAGGRFEVVDYEALIGDGTLLPGPWDLIICNYCLLSDPLAPLLAALRHRLDSGGRLFIQTVHPWLAAGEGGYANGWREETFATIDEPIDFANGKPLSIIFECVAATTAGGRR